MVVHAASWAGGIQVRLYVKDGVDWALVRKVRWYGSGEEKVLYDGPVGGM
jgi:hypothetical protein